MNKNDDLGDRMKEYEARETTRAFLPMIPIYARIDGRGFSKFTKGLERPYDVRMSECMIETTAHLVDKTNAVTGYTQSDEISLCWLTESPKSEVFFKGKIQKMVSVLAGMTTAKFMQELAKNGLSDRLDRLPHFDCRVFQLPNKTEVANAFLWREQDAAKNAVSMAARSVYSHKELQGKSSSEMQEMLFERGINFNDYPAFFKRGTFLKRRTYDAVLTPEELSRIPEAHRPTGPVTRSRVERLEVPTFSKVVNRTGFIFDDENPKVYLSDLKELFA